MKTLIFLRHGQTLLNKHWVHQFDDTVLSGTGRAQAAAIAPKLAALPPFDVILTSNLTRTKQTAEVVNRTLKVPIEESDLFVELRRPTELAGKSWFSLHSNWIMAQLYLFANRDNWHYSDEENLEEFHARARRALEYLADRKEERILVVTHRGFMANLIERMKKDGMDTVAEYRRALWKNLEIGNCCFFEATWTPSGEDGMTLEGTWKVLDGYTCPLEK